MSVSSDNCIFQKTTALAAGATSSSHSRSDGRITRVQGLIGCTYRSHRVHQSSIAGILTSETSHPLKLIYPGDLILRRST